MVVARAGELYPYQDDTFDISVLRLHAGVFQILGPFDIARLVEARGAVGCLQDALTTIGFVAQFGNNGILLFLLWLGASIFCLCASLCLRYIGIIHLLIEVVAVGTGRAL